MDVKNDVKTEFAPYLGWNGCLHLRSDHLEIVVSTRFGPRVLHLSAPGDDNLFWLDPAWTGEIAEGRWVNYGGHRLWHAPEIDPRTYQPDNDPVEVDEVAGGATLRGPLEPATGIAKSLTLTLEPDRARARVIHALENRGVWPVRLAPWAISVMAPGGVAVVPLPPRGPHGGDGGLLPTGRIALWRYTDLRDPRWTWGSRYVLLAQGDGAPQKAGFEVPAGWAAYALAGTVFVKRFVPRPGATYPDAGSMVETFTNDAMLELETLGPLVELAPGARVEHEEIWELRGGVAQPGSEADVEAWDWATLDPVGAEAS